jgi:hypothetical protein
MRIGTEFVAAPIRGAAACWSSYGFVLFHHSRAMSACMVNFQGERR